LPEYETLIFLLTLCIICIYSKNRLKLKLFLWHLKPHM